MATTQPLPPPPAPPPTPSASASADAAAEELALLPIAASSDEEGLLHLSWPVSQLLVELDVAIPVREFRVRNLLAMEAGMLIESEWANGEDMPLASGKVQLAWCEFEVIETELAVRVTRLV